nr:MAG TPA: hypothetical protein [Caudoviricetes sp.]
MDAKFRPNGDMGLHFIYSREVPYMYRCAQTVI